MNSSEALSGKIALVTGGNRGIGLELCRQLLERGATVLMTARTQSKGEDAAQCLQAKHEQLFVYSLDVCDDQQAIILADLIQKKFKRIDILINNAGVALDKFVPSSQLDLSILRQTLETNVMGVFKTTQALLPLLKASGDARVVNVSSQLGSLSKMTGSTLAYRMSKTALNAMTRVWATELEADGILVNSVCPGWVRTELGGQEAPISPAEGAREILALAQFSSARITGTFYRDGVEHPW